MVERYIIFVVLLVLCQTEISCGHKRHLRVIKVIQDKVSNLERRVDNSSSDVSCLHQELNVLKKVIEGIQTDALNLDNKLGERIANIEDKCDMVVWNKTISDRPAWMPTDSLKTDPFNRTISNDQNIHQFRLVLGTMITRFESAERRIKSLEDENVLLKKTLDDYLLKTNYTMNVTAGTDFDTVSAQRDTRRTTTTPPMTTSMNKSRLVLAPNYQDIPRFYQMFLHNNSVQNLTCGNLAAKIILSVAYHPNSNSLIFAQGDPHYNVVLCSLDTGQVSMIMHGTSTWGLAVDRRTQRVLVSTHTPTKTVSVVDLDGKDMEKMADLSELPYGIVFDSVNGRTYVTDYNTLMSVTNSGQVVKLDSGSEMRALAVDGKGEYLYYNERTTLKRLALSRNETSRVAILPYIPWNFVFRDDVNGNSILYVSSFYDGKVGAVYLDENWTYDSLHEANGCNGVAICLLT